MNKFALLTTRKFFLFLFVFLITHSPNHLITESPNYPITYLYAVENLTLTETKLATIPLDYQEVSNIIFSANGKQVAYKVRKEGKEFVVVGNKAGKPYDQVVKEGDILLSPDGQRVAYQAKRGEKEYLVFDGKESEPYDDVSPTTFSPDGRLVVCEVGDKGKWFILVSDGKKEIFHSPHYDSSNIPPVFSPDNRLIAYVLSDQERGEYTTFITDILSGKVRKAFVSDSVGNIVFSGGGSRFARVARKEGKSFMVIGDLALNEEKEGQPYDWIGVLFSLSSDGRRVAYETEKGGRKFVVVSDWVSPAGVKENGPYDFVGVPVFSPNGSLVAYPAWKEGKWYVVIGEKEYPFYDGVVSPVFSPDGSKVAHPAMKDGKWFVVGGKSDGSVPHHEGPAYDMVVSPIFSPDGSKIIYRARLGSAESGQAKRFIVIADANTGAVIKEGPVCDEVLQPVISPDGKLVCYGARTGRELWWKVESAD